MNPRFPEVLGKLIAAAIVLLLIAAVIGTLYFGIDRLLDWAANLDRSVGIALLICFTVFLSARTLSKSIFRSRKLDHEERLRRHRAHIYRRLLILWSADNAEGRDRDREAIEKDLLLWGSAEVIRRYLDLRHANQRGPQYAKALEDWLRAIRADIGSRNGGLAEGDLFGLLMNNDQKSPSKPGSAALAKE